MYKTKKSISVFKVQGGKTAKLFMFAVTAMKQLAIAFLLLLFFSSNYLNAQDSTLLRIQKLKDDTVKVNRFIAYGKSISRSDASKARVVLNKAIQLAKKLNDENGMAQAILNLGYINLSAGNYQDCVDEFKNAVHIYRKSGNLKEMSSAQLDLSAGFSALGQRDSALYYCMLALKQLETLPHSRQLTRAYLNAGTQYNNLRSYTIAISYQKKALDLATKANDTTMLLNIYSALSLSYDNQNNKQEAYEMIHKAMPLLTIQSNKAAACRTYDQYASASIGIGRYNEAIVAAEQAMAIAKEINDVNHYCSSATTLAKAYNEKGNPQKTIEVLNQLAQNSENANNVLLEDFYALLADAYYKTGNYTKAAEAYNKLLPIKDSVFNNETNEMIADQEVNYQTAQKEKQLSENKLQLVQKDLQLQKNRYYMYYAFSALIVALLIVGMLVLRYKHKRRMHEQELKSMHQQKELQLLQALMQGEEKERSRIAKDLHDGVAGMLAAVKMHLSSIPGADDLMQFEGYQKGMQLLNEATHEIRKTSHNLMPEVLLQHGLDEALNRYCSTINNSKMLQIEYDAWGEIDRFTDSFELSVYRIVQELLNNIIKHSKATRAIVQLTQQDDLLSISIEDNGVGFSNGNTKEGMGLKSLQSRIKAMNGKLEVESSEQSGVSAYLEFEVADLKKEAAVEYE